MKKVFLVILSLLLAASLLSGCADVLGTGIELTRNPFMPIQGTPVPEPNAPLLKTPEPTSSPESTQKPITSTNPKPAPTSESTATPEPTAIPDILKIAMLSDDSDNKAYSLGKLAWSGIESACLDFGYEPVFMETPAMDTKTILDSIDKLVTDNCRLIILPSYRFKDALYKAQNIYPDTNFILFGFDGTMGNNVVTVVFAEEEAAFLAGVAAAVEITTSLGFEKAEFGIVIEETTLSAQRYTEGFRQGVEYAFAEYGTAVTLEEKFISYLEMANDPKGALQTANALFDSGADCILNLAGGSGAGLIEGAVDFTSWGMEVYTIGVDYDQFDEGIYGDNLSVVLTSVVKYYDTAVYDMIKTYAAGDFPGGTSVHFDISMGGIGLSLNNPNLSPSTVMLMDEVFSLIEDNSIFVQTLEDLQLMPFPTLPPLITLSPVPTLPPSITLPPTTSLPPTTTLPPSTSLPPTTTLPPMP